MTGYHRPRSHPAATALSLGCVAGLVALIATAGPGIFVPPDRPFLGRNIPLPEDPPVIPDKPVPSEARAARPTPLNRPDPEIAVPSDPVDIGTALATFPVAIDATVTGTAAAGTGTDPVAPPAKPDPVLVAAAMARGVVLQPDYPASERRAGIEGIVTVRVLIGTDGRVKAVEAVGTPRPALFEATRRHALARWRFTPATRDGVPYETWRQFTVRFVLDQA